MRILALDASTKTGWALFVDGKLTESGALPAMPVEDFNVNKDPQKAPKYPYNVVDGALRIAEGIKALVEKCDAVDVVVIENTNKGKNRHTQRLLEFMHFCILIMLRSMPKQMEYMDTSEWRSLVGLWMTKDDKKNNRDVSAGKKRGKITKKHLAVRTVNERYGMKLKQKDNDQADAILLGQAYIQKRETQAQ
jgi:hypothetical protein